LGNVRDLSLGLSRVSSVTLDLGDEIETGGDLSEDGLSEKGKERGERSQRLDRKGGW